MKEIQVKFKEMLLSTNREGMEEIVVRLEEAGFFKAPASTKFHLNYEGGLLEHSMNVCNLALELRDLMIRKKEGMGDSLPKESVIIAALYTMCAKPMSISLLSRSKRALWVFGMMCQAMM